MPSNFSGKLVVITGAASGIGRATAIKLSSLGAIIHLSDVNSPGLAETAALLSPTPQGHSTQLVDVSDTNAINNWINSIVAGDKPIDHVFSCAGINPTAYNLTDTSDDYWDKIVNTNLRGTYALTRACMPHLRSGSSIVNVASVLGTRGAARMAIYSATKWGVIGFTKSMALELGPKGIRVNAVAPGYIDTPTNCNVVEGEESVRVLSEKVGQRRFGSAEEVADVVVWLMGAEAGYVNGSVVEINGGLP